MKHVVINGRAVGSGAPCFLIAEAGVNHNGELDKALQLVDVAAAAGVDAVKFQIIHAEAMVTRDAPLAHYQERNAGGFASTQYDMLKRLELPDGAYATLRRHCDSHRLVFLATPFDTAGVDLLAGLDVPAFKIASGEITNPALLTHVAAMGRPVILSTGMSTLEEIEMAINTLRSAGNNDIVLLHCVSNYPVAPEDVNLRAMQTMSLAFGLPVGFSDHTAGIEIAPAAVAAGACVIEKHFTLDRSLPGPDHAASIEPDELERMARNCRIVERAMGNGRKLPAVCEIDIACVARRSLTAARAIPAGATLTTEDLTLRRPGTGFMPSMRERLIGRMTARNIPAGMLFTDDMFESYPAADTGERRVA